MSVEAVWTFRAYDSCPSCESELVMDITVDPAEARAYKGNRFDEAEQLVIRELEGELARHRSTCKGTQG
jgi:hypothetical protein